MGLVVAGAVMPVVGKERVQNQELRGQEAGSCR